MKDNPIKKVIIGCRVLFVSIHVLFVSMSVCASIQYRCNFADILKLDTIQSPTGQQFLKFTGQDIWGYGISSYPEMPYSTVRFLVPDNACNFTVEIDEIGDVLTYETNLPLYPVQEAISINDFSSDMFTEPDYEAYDIFNSSHKAEVIDDSWIEGRYHIVTVSLYPVACSSGIKKISICQDMSITLKFEEKSTPSKKRYSGRKKGIVNISDIVVNPESMDLIQGKSIPSVDDEYVEPDRYYIISEKSLLPAFDDLVAWKTQKGYIVTLKSIEDILEDSRYKVGSSTAIVDEAASLRKYLQDEENEFGSFFCLLVGDHKTKMPIRKVKYTDDDIKDDYGSNGDAYIPTDNYFSDLSENWDNLYLDKSGIYVQDASNTRFNPDIYVGRLLCHNSDQVSNYVSKLILYETNPGRGSTEYLDQASIFVQYDGKSYYDKIKSGMNKIFGNVDCYLDTYINDINTSGYPTGEMMLNRINECGYSSLMGHGEPSSIACSGLSKKGWLWQYIKALESYSYENGQTQISNNCSNSGVDKMSNFNSPTVVYTLSCTSTPFDIYDNGFRFDLTHTMSSSLTVGGLYGAVAYLGNTRNGYWKYSSEMEKIFLDQLQSCHKLGIAEALSKYKYANYYGKTVYPRHGHNLIGDPEFEMWTGKPNLLNIMLTCSDDFISLIGIDQIGCRATVNDGLGNITVLDLKKQISHNLRYLNNNDRMVAVGLHGIGHLPIVTLVCDNQLLVDCTKNFVVRNARLGFSSDKVDIGRKANVSIRTIDKAECGNSLTISSGGILSISSDKTIDISGSVIYSGGEMKISGKEIYVSEGFSVKKGGVFSVNKKN